LFALIPKCLLCLAAYAGLGAVLGRSGPEICGGPAGSPGSWLFSLALPGGTMAIAALRSWLRCRRCAA
jgi:hypothetical protein